MSRPKLSPIERIRLATEAQSKVEEELAAKPAPLRMTAINRAAVHLGVTKRTVERRLADYAVQTHEERCRAVRDKARETVSLYFDACPPDYEEARETLSHYIDANPPDYNE